MDSKQPLSDQEVEARLAAIKAYMPNVYSSIEAKAREIGRVAYRLVRRGVKGAPNCFYAFEAGRVVGTPFGGHPIMSDVAMSMVEFGCAHICIWQESANTAHSAGTEVAHGAH